MDIPPYDDVVMQIVSRESNLHCSVSSIRTLPGLLLSSLKGEFLNSFVIAWVIEMSRGHEHFYPEFYPITKHQGS